MKRLLLAILLLTGFQGFSQTKGISYQAVILSPSDQELPGQNAAGNILANTAVSIQFTIVNAAAGKEFQEFHRTSTDGYGMINLLIGTGTSTGSVKFPDIVWDGTIKKLKVGIDFAGGTNFSALSEQNLTYMPQPVNDQTAQAIAGILVDQAILKQEISEIELLRGEQGEVGAQGIQGEVGPQGIKGDKGDTGAQGIQGEVGPQGPAGNDGINGIAGATGAQGPIGPIGATGATGPKGPAGLDGAIGPMGPQGPAGLNGVDGANGINGLDGDDGVNGAPGLDGAIGPMGPQGPAGLNGVDGANGINGLDGLPGIPGLPGPVGPAGLDGLPGIPGLPGQIGPAGATGAQGTKGDTGLKGDTGAQGIKGDKGDGLTNGTEAGQMMYWNGTAWVVVATTANEGAALQLIGGVPTWVGGTPPTAPGAPTIGTATGGNAQATVAFTAPTSNGGAAITTYTATSSPGGITGTVSQAGSGTITVTGLTNGTAYTFTVTATNSAGTGDASAASNSVTPVAPPPPPPSVTSSTGRVWMDRNLGATQVATSSTDAASYGDLYQWGRGTDGHQIITSGTTTTRSSTDSPGNDKFIIPPFSDPYDWLSPQNANLWQGVSGVNNPCPTGYRLPTGAEWEAELATWSTNDPAGAFDSPLKLPVAGQRNIFFGLYGVGTTGDYWSSTAYDFGPSIQSLHLALDSNSSTRYAYQAQGMSVRCIQDGAGTPPAAPATAPGPPTIGTATAGDAQATVAFTAPASDGGAAITTYTATSSPGNITGTVTQAGSGTITVTGLTNGTAYTFTVTATNSVGTGVASAASNSVTPVAASLPPSSTDVTSPTGRVWMDRNLGATQVATSSTDAASYGDLYQWGRAADGHQLRTSTATTATLSSSDTPGNGDFITSSDDWRSTSNDNLWQGASGTNNPCPSGYRLPTETEWEAERLTWTGGNNAAGAFASLLKLPMAGSRNRNNGSLGSVGTFAVYWSSTVSSTSSRVFYFFSGGAGSDTDRRAVGNSVRCIQDVVSTPPATAPGAPTIGTATAGDAQATVAFTAPASDGGAAITTYTATSNPGSITGTVSQAGSGTITVTGLTNGTAYTFTVTATNSTGTGVASAASNSVTPAAAAPSVTTVTSSTGRVWMDRNLGATQAATSSTDAASYGDLYQWGRGTDGHQSRTSATTATLSSGDTPVNGNFITGSSDWRSSQNDNLWQGVNGVNNPCPTGYRLPTETEWESERASWSANTSVGAFASPLKLPMGGNRDYSGSLFSVGTSGRYWSSTVSSTDSDLFYLYIDSRNALMDTDFRAAGCAVRCIQDSLN
jgi:uncharacterized protein (TIGR02145 family)